MLDKLRVPEWCCAVRFNTDGHTVFDVFGNTVYRVKKQSPLLVRRSVFVSAGRAVLFVF